MKTLKNVLLLLMVWATAVSPCLAMRYVDSSVRSVAQATELADGPNLYTYVEQSPWTKFDPDGRAEMNFEEETLPQGGPAESGETAVEGGEGRGGGGGGAGGGGGGSAPSETAPTAPSGVAPTKATATPTSPPANSPPPSSPPPAQAGATTATPTGGAPAPVSPATVPLSPPSAPAENSPANAPSNAPAPATIATPQGPATQSSTPEAQAALQQVQNGATVYRQGVFGRQNTTGAQYWGINNPATTPGFAARMGATGGSAKPDWIMGGTVAPDSPAITRPAPGVAPNPGGDIEVVTPPGGVQNLWFHMPD